jgi:hypothetical protein
MGLFAKKKKSSGPFQFRVSDAVAVPLRGYLLRLKVQEGEPALSDVAPGRKLRVRGPAGGERIIRVHDYSATEGVPSQEKLDQRRELDIVITQEDGLVDGEEIQIGWTASGPVHD